MAPVTSPITVRDVFINRNPELKLLDDLLASNADRRILLLQAESGYGKSVLLERYQQRIAEREHDLAVIDLDELRGGAVALLTSAVHQWGSEHFTRFSGVLKTFGATASHQEAKNILQFFGRIEQAQHDSPGLRETEIAMLTDAWFEDARDWMSPDRPAVMLVDTYNRVDTVALEGMRTRPATVDPEMHAWIETAFLAQVRRTPGLRLILAGQQPPERGTTAWERCCRRRPLGPISNPDDWMEYAAAIGVRVTTRDVSLLCHTEQGHPWRIALRLSMLLTWSVVA